MKISSPFPVPPPGAAQTAGRPAAAERAGARIPAGADASVPAERAGKAGLPSETAAPKTQAGAGQNLLFALKLPNDSLSESLVSFFRYFSLPLEPKTLGAARREALSQPKREAAALALAAAADKGLALEGRALTEYADALDPAGPRSRGGGEEDAGTEGGFPRESGAEYGGGGSSSGGGEQGRGGNGQTRRDTNARNPAGRAPPAEEIRETVTGILENRPVLDLLNRVSGKRGRWMAFPFSFSSGNAGVQGSFRVFVHEDTAEHLAADIVVRRKNSGAETRWYFLLDKTRQRLEFARKPPAAGGRKLIAHLAGLFGLSPGSVVMRDDTPLFGDAKDCPQSVDEEI
jgi:hypothetical protein